MLAACTSGGPTTDIRPGGAGRVPSGSSPVEGEDESGAGFVLGITLLVDGKADRSFSHRTPKWSPESGVLRLTAVSDAGKPPEGEFIVTGLLDFSTRVLLDEMKAHTFNPRQERTDYSVGVHGLRPGRHCLLFAAMEDPSGAVASETGQDEVSGLFFVTVGKSERDWCASARLTNSTVDQLDATSPLAGGCIPNLSPSRDGLEVRRHVVAVEALWAVVPICSTFAVGVLVRDGELQGEDSSFPPLFPPTGVTRPGWIERLEPLPPAGWNLLAAQESLETTVSQPVVVERP